MFTFENITAIIYAFQKTGLLVGEDNLDKISENERKRWDKAITEYH